MPPRKKRKVLANTSNKAKDLSLWSHLKRRSPYSSVHKPNYWQLLSSRRINLQKKKVAFRSGFRAARRSGRPGNLKLTVERLVYWAKYNSWSYCEKCGLLATKTLLPTSFTQKGLRLIKGSTCHCSKGRYKVPRYKQIPRILRALSAEDESLLRVLAIDVGPRKFAPMGHRVKNGAFEVYVRDESVRERIDAVRESGDGVR